MDINVLSAPAANRFSPKSLNAAFHDITHSGLLLAGFGKLITIHSLTSVNASAPRLTQSTRDCQSVIKKQASFYCQQIMTQLAHTIVSGEQAAEVQIALSQSMQNMAGAQTDLALRQAASSEVNQVSSVFNQYYVRAKELAEMMVTINRCVKSEFGKLSHYLDQYARHLPQGRENALAIMTDIDLLDDSLGQCFDKWVAHKIKSGEGINHFLIAEDSVGGGVESFLQLYVPERDGYQQLGVAVQQHYEQRRELYQELGKISRILVGIKTVAAEIRLYSNYMGRLHRAAKRLSANWGKVSNDFAIQAYQLGAQSDSNQLFQIVANDIPVATCQWRNLFEDIAHYRQSFSNPQTMFPVAG